MSNKKVLSYEDFVNEEINLKKALAGAALGAGLMFGNPTDATAQQPVQTEVSIDSIYDYSKVFEVDSLLKKSDIKTKITSQIYNSLSGIRILTNTPDKITCSVTMNAKPDNSNGVCYATMDVSFKDGKYKVEFSNIYFVYVGTQPQTAGQQLGQNLNRQLTGMATNALTGTIRNPILRNMTQQAVNTTVRNVQNSNQTNSNINYKDSNNQSFVNSVNAEISKITTTFQSAFSTNTNNGWWFLIFFIKITYFLNLINIFAVKYNIMVTKEIKQFVITQMKESDWEVESFNNINQYKSKHININHDTSISQKVTFTIKILTTGYGTELKITRKELELNYFKYRFLLGSVKKSCNLVDKRKRESEIDRHWKKFLENNKELKRDNKINQVLD